MAIRQNTVLLKRSNVIGKIPPLSGVSIGELALNTADAKLYTSFTSGTTGATEVRQIGWDRLSVESGGTVNGDVIINNSFSASTISITSTPTLDQTLTDYLVRDSNTGELKYKTVQPSYITTTSVTTSGYTASTNFTYYGVTFSGETNIEIPSAVGLDGFNLKIKDERGTASIFRIRVTSNSGNIDGNNYVDMNSNYMSLTFLARNNNWWII